ncbi:MAG: diguanylate cyclase domain-containing protein [Aristaeellaceae bacterium]
MSNYTAVTLLSCLTIGVLSVLVYENIRFNRATKQRFYLTYAMIVLSTLAEWAGVALNGMPAWTMGLHSLVKCIDYIATPVAGICFALQVSDEGEWKKHRWMVVILLGNALLEIISMFTGWTFYIDGDNMYRHGPLYTVYTVVYGLAIVDVFMAFREYSRKFPRQNHMSLYAVILLSCTGIALQELGGGDIRTSCVSLALGSVLLFAHYNEFLQQRDEERLRQQEKLLATDTLTGLGSRYAYIRALSGLQNRKTLPEGLAVFSVDINGLKAVNDTQGHAAGDQLIRSAADCMAQAMGRYGACYRTGGDEFVAILEHVGQLEIAAIYQAMEAEQRSRDGVSLSMGHALAADHPELSMEELVDIADKHMYVNKDAHYQRMGVDASKTDRRHVCL